MQQEPKYVTVEKAAEFLEVHQETVRRLLREHKIKGTQTLTRRWRIDWPALVEFKKGYKPEGE